MKNFKFIASETLESFKKNLGISSLDIYKSKSGNEYIVVGEDAIMLARDLDKTKPIAVVTIETTNDAGEPEKFRFLGNNTREVVGTL